MNIDYGLILIMLDELTLSRMHVKYLLLPCENFIWNFIWNSFLKIYSNQINKYSTFYSYLSIKYSLNQYEYE